MKQLIKSVRQFFVDVYYISRNKKEFIAEINKLSEEHKKSLEVLRDTIDGVLVLVEKNKKTNDKEFNNLSAEFKNTILKLGETTENEIERLTAEDAKISDALNKLLTFLKGSDIRNAHNITSIHNILTNDVQQR